MRYITRKRFKKKCIQGFVNFPYNTVFDCLDNGMITYNNLPVCYNTSQDGLDYFCRDDDKQGIVRGKLIEDILKFTSNKKDINKYNEIWKYLWNNDIIKNKFKRSDHDDVWLWDFKFYNASIQELQNVLYKLKTI